MSFRVGSHQHSRMLRNKHMYDHDKYTAHDNCRNQQFLTSSFTQITRIGRALFTRAPDACAGPPQRGRNNPFCYQQKASHERRPTKNTKEASDSGERVHSHPPAQHLINHSYSPPCPHYVTLRVSHSHMKSPMRRFFGSKIRRQSSGCISRFIFRMNRRSSVKASWSARS